MDSFKILSSVNSWYFLSFITSPCHPNISHLSLIGSAPFLMCFNPLHLPFSATLSCHLVRYVSTPLWFLTSFLLLPISLVICFQVVLIFCVWPFSETNRLEWPSRTHSVKHQQHTDLSKWQRVEWWNSGRRYWVGVKPDMRKGTQQE